jgi:hypothetical protein
MNSDWDEYKHKYISEKPSKKENCLARGIN